MIIYRRCDSKLREPYPNIKGKHGFRPLHWAAMAGNVPLTNLLIKHGADPSKTNLLGDLPTHWAAWTGHLETFSDRTIRCSKCKGTGKTKGK